MTHRTGTWEPTEGAVLVGEGLHAGYPGRADVLDCAAEPRAPESAII